MPDPKKITSSRELAKLAGVSHMTVSRAFRNDPSISNETRDRILKLAEKHGYKANPIHTLHMRRQEKGGKTAGAKGSIAFVHNNHSKGSKLSSWKHFPHQRPIIIGMEKQAAEYGFTLNEFYVGPHEGGLTTARLNGILKAKGIVGVIMGPPTHKEAYDGIDWDHLVGTALTHHEFPPHLPRVSFDNLHTVHTCYENLQQLGCKRIGICAPVKFDEYHLHVWTGSMLVRNQKSGSGMNRPLFLYADPVITNAVDEFYAWLGEEKPDGLICIDRAIRELVTAHGLRVPEDIALAHTAAEEDVKDWSGYKIDREAQGKATVDLLMSRMIHNEFRIPESRTETLLRGKWQHGSTTKTPDA